MKRKSTDDNSAAAAAAATEAGHSKKRRLSHEEAHGTTAAEAKRVKKDKTAKKAPKDKGKKDKKAKKTREEQAAALDAVYDQDELDVDQEPQTEDGADRSKDGSATDAQSAQPAAADKKKSKKSKKEKKPAAEPQAGEGDSEGGADDSGNANANAGQPPQSKKSARFIVFVGNLPYSAKVDDIQKHFAAVHPTAVRLMHEKTNPNKSRGIAFVEFAGYDHMKTCLKTLHHSTLTCEGRDHRGRPKTEERKINVELTAGGGGNTDFRKEKIRAKNEKLAGERHRRAEAEEKEKLKKEKKRLFEGGEKKGDDEGVHPSRRARVPGGPR